MSLFLGCLSRSWGSWSWPVLFWLALPFVLACLDLSGRVVTCRDVSSIDLTCRGVCRLFWSDLVSVLLFFLVYVLAWIVLHCPFSSGLVLTCLSLSRLVWICLDLFRLSRLVWACLDLPGPVEACPDWPMLGLTWFGLACLAWICLLFSDLVCIDLALVCLWFDLAFLAHVCEAQACRGCHT